MPSCDRTPSINDADTERATTRKLFKRCLRLARERNDAMDEAARLRDELARVKTETQHMALEKRRVRTLTDEGESNVD